MQVKEKETNIEKKANTTTKRDYNRSEISSKTITKLNKTKTLNIDDFFPCEIIGIKEKALWKFLPKKSSIYIYQNLLQKLDLFSKQKRLSSKDIDLLEHTLAEETQSLSYLPYYIGIINKIRTFTNLNKSRTSIIENMEDRLRYLAFNEESLEAILIISSYYYSQKKYDLSSELVTKVIVSSRTNSSYQDFYLESLSKAKSPNQLAATMLELSKAPIPNFSHLIDLRKRNSNSDFQYRLDLIAEKLIENRLSSKETRSLDLLSYNIALKIHSKGEALKRRYGRAKQFIDFKRSNDPSTEVYGQKDCDDRELIDLCDKYCDK